MKLKTSKSGKTILKLTKAEWESYGKEMGYMQEEIKTASLSKEDKMEKIAESMDVILEDPKSLDGLSAKALQNPVVMEKFVEASTNDPMFLSKVGSKTILNLIKK